MFRNFIVLLFLSGNVFAKITIASGSVLGHYYTLATKFCNEKQKQGVECEVLETSGSLENLALLKKQRVDYAIVQNDLHHYKIKQTLGTEQFYFFYKNIAKPKNINQLMDFVGNQYTVDKKSGSYATLEKLSKIFGFTIQGNTQSLETKKQGFVNRNTKLSIYHIAKESYVFAEMQAENISYYTFSFSEKIILQMHGFYINEQGLIETQTDLIKKNT